MITSSVLRAQLHEPLGTELDGGNHNRSSESHTRRPEAAIFSFFKTPLAPTGRSAATEIDCASYERRAQNKGETSNRLGPIGAFPTADKKLAEIF